MSTLYGIAFLRQTTRAVANFFTNDLKALPEESLTVCPGGVARLPLEVVAECASVNGYVAKVLAGVPAEQGTDEERAAYRARFDSRETALALFQEEADRLFAAIDGLDESALGKMVPHPFGHEDTLFAVAALPLMHMMYHDGQFNYLQSLHGDKEMHWR